jgi:uncharacterized membrane protein YhhN
MPTPSLMIATAAVLLLALLLVAEKKERTLPILAAKTPLSLLFILAALSQPNTSGTYYGLLLAGLCFCLGGDVLLALPGRSFFLCGLVSFLTGHIFYVIAFFAIASSNPLMWGGAVAVVATSALVFRWLRPHLGSMTLPVIFYIVVISGMLIGALAVAGQGGISTAFRWLVLTGATCFYVSDLFVARQRFVKHEPLNRFIGLPLYYSGQFLLAFSVGLAG